MDSILILLGLVLAAIFVLPIIALVRTMRISNLERRLEGVEAALLRATREIEFLKTKGAPAVSKPEAPAAPIPEEPSTEPAPPAPGQPPEPVFTAARSGAEARGAPVSPPPPGPVPAAAQPSSGALEAAIGQRWLGWIAISLILFAAAFFLKYAFENRWIGEVGRVMIGVFAGLGFVWAGWQRHQAGWRYFSQVLTAGGVILVYLSTYASFGFYQLVDQRTAFLFLVLVVLQGHLLAVAYDSRAIALMSQFGGFLVPLLLSSGRDQYVVLFTYIAVLNGGVVLLSFLRRWRWVASFSFVMTHLLYWAWHGDYYHPEKRAAVLAFQLVIFGLFLLADLAPQFRGQASSEEQWARLFVNPFVFFATAYHVLKTDYSDWMGAFAILMAIVYGAIARAGMGAESWDRRTLLVSIGVALTFVTLAIPIQLDPDWITLGWAAQGAVMMWLSPKVGSRHLAAYSAVVFGLAIFRHLEHDTPWYGRSLFDPVLNSYFLGTLALIGFLLLAAYFAREVKGAFAPAAVTAALALFWLAMSVETYTYSDAREAALPPTRTYEDIRQIRWQSQMVLSVLWSLYAAGLVAAGFRLAKSALRWAGLGLFGLTLAKVVLVDMSQLQQIYRIIAFLALGVLLLGVAWTYQRVSRREQPS